MLTITKINGHVLPPVRRGEQRQWMTCTRCGWTGYRDFIPYGLSNPIIVMNCGHDVVDSSTRRTVTPNEAVSLITAFIRREESC